jgi:hypothetical protein
MSNNEKQVGIELKKTVSKLEEAKEQAIKNMGGAISLAADAGDIILSAKTEGLDLDLVLEVAGINGEQARRLERVAKNRPALSAPNSTQLKQLALWAGVLPDPIETSIPKAEKLWHDYIVKARQWIASKSVKTWSDTQRLEFIEEAKPIVEAYKEAGGE